VNGINGSVALVTGASRGIGEAIARALLGGGAVVHVLAEDAGVVTAASAIGATAHRADITDEKAVERVMAAIGSIDILVNNAGLERLTPIEDTSSESLAVFRRIIDINLVGTSIVTAHALVSMPDGSRIINTASVWGRVAEPLFGAYVASKHGVIGLTKTWAKELGARGIRVNAVAPGWVRTEASVRSARSLAVRQGRAEGAIIDDVAAGQALPGGLMEPDDIVGAYLYLASDLSANVTGQTLGVDRGEAPW
jgi:NAD(P)-dependent dehydrogenase (short-subunit alcohol dehydrogenase family)